MYKRLKCALLHKQKIYMTTPAGRKVLFICAECSPGAANAFDTVGGVFGFGRQPDQRPPELRN